MPMTILAHPRWRGVVAAAVSALFLGTLFLPLSQGAFLAGAGLLGAIAAVIIWRIPADNRLPMSPPLCMATLAAAGLLIGIQEWLPLKWLILVAGAVAAGWIAAQTPDREPVPFMWRQTRRLISAIVTADAAAIFIVIFSLDIFFPATSMAFLSVLIGGVSAMGAWTLWRLYDIPSGNGAALRALAFGLSAGELAWAIHLLPFGYGAKGVFLAWVWHGAVLLGRFDQTPQGIDWHRQRWFLLSSVAVIALLLIFFLRWI